MIPFWETLLKGSLYISAVGVMAWYWLRVQRSKPIVQTEIISIKSRRSVGHQQQLLLVSVKGREMLLAQTPSAISFLTNLPTDSPDSTQSEHTGGISDNLDFLAVPTSGIHLAETSACKTHIQPGNNQIAANDI